MPNPPQFFVEEYKCIRKEIEWLLKDYRELERNIALAVCVIWGWLLRVFYILCKCKFLKPRRNEWESTRN
jgi:hypothetical protein